MSQLLVLPAILVVLYTLIVLFDLLPVIKNGLKREYLAYIACLAVSFAVLMLSAFDIKVPGPTNWLIRTIGKLFHM